jgi:ribosome-binding protein aMBF1 (putative translation factor)
MQVAQLIELAASIQGGYAQLARELGIPDSVVHHYRTGRRSCPLDIQAMLADIAGFNATNQVNEAMLAKHEGTARGERLRHALAKAMRPDFRNMVQEAKRAADRAKS